MSQGIRDNHGGKVPESLLALMAFDGIARKTAVLLLNKALGKFEGIGTDIHVPESKSSWFPGTLLTRCLD
jgi:endonuclease III